MVGLVGWGGAPSSERQSERLRGQEGLADFLQNGDQGTKVGGNKRQKLQILASRLAAVVCQGENAAGYVGR